MAAEEISIKHDDEISLDLTGHYLKSVFYYLEMVLLFNYILLLAVLLSLAVFLCARQCQTMEMRVQDIWCGPLMHCLSHMKLPSIGSFWTRSRTGWQNEFVSRSV